MNENTTLAQCHAYAMGYQDGLHKGFRSDYPDVNPQYRHYYNPGYDRGVADWAALEARKTEEDTRDYVVRYHTTYEQVLTVRGFDAENACEKALAMGITDLASKVIDQQWQIEEAQP